MEQQRPSSNEPTRYVAEIYFRNGQKRMFRYVSRQISGDERYMELSDGHGTTLLVMLDHVATIELSLVEA